jgi:hypothetical protein
VSFRVYGPKSGHKIATPFDQKSLVWRVQPSEGYLQGVQVKQKVDYRPDFDCQKDCDGWKAKFTIRLVGDIYVATGPFPYRGRQPEDRHVRDTESALRHEQSHTDDKVNISVPSSNMSRVRHSVRRKNARTVPQMLKCKLGRCGIKGQRKVSGGDTEDMSGR